MRPGVPGDRLPRTFPDGRDELISAVVAWEFLDFFIRLYEEVQEADSLER